MNHSTEKNEKAMSLPNVFFPTDPPSVPPTSAVGSEEGIMNSRGRSLTKVRMNICYLKFSTRKKIKK